MTDEQYRNLANRLLDDYCDIYGAEAGVIYLLDLGYTRDEIVELDFDENFVDKIIAEEKKASKDDK